MITANQLFAIPSKTCNLIRSYGIQSIFAMIILVDKANSVVHFRYNLYIDYFNIEVGKYKGVMNI